MIAITGASGLLGGNLIRELLSQGQRVRALIHNDGRAVSGLDLETVSVALNDASSLEHAFNGMDVVYHLASVISLRMDSWDDVYSVNVLGTRNVVEACLRSGVKRLVYFGSVHSRSHEPFDRPFDEDRPLVTDGSLPPYDRSKALAELEVQAGLGRGLDAIVLLPSAIVGPYDFRPSYVGESLQLMRRGGLPILPRGGYDWVDARDVSIGATAAAKKAKAGSCYILSGHWHSVSEVASIAARIGGKHASHFTVPLKLAEFALPIMEKVGTLRGSQPLYTKAMLNALNSNHNISQARAARDLGYSPRPFLETLTDTLNWFAAQRTSP